jgi:hypothetical protein
VKGAKLRLRPDFFVEVQMRRLLLAIAFILGVCNFGFSGTLTIVPTTTLQAQTSNNTSAANSFTAQTNGNMTVANISKMDLHSLLYPGATTKIYAHMMLWFGGPSPMNVGYNSKDAAQVHRQIQDMISRGVDGVIMDWYGPGNFEDDVAKLVMAEVETHPGFTFAIMVDKGAIYWNSCSGCTPQQALISQIQYIQRTYFPSPAYMKINGKPVITNFDLDLHFTIDWNAVNTAVGGNIAYIFQHAAGFTHLLSGGSYSWIMPATTDYGMSYMTKFYDAALANPAEEAIGAVYKGFNDTLASWTMNRIMSQQCGQTWLQTFDELNHFYNSGTQLAALQLPTWNDYEEATEIETGIDNCLSVATNLSGTALQWGISGNENTIDHYVVYISTDGQNLMSLTTLPAGSRTVDISSYSLAAGTYTLYLQAVGKATLKNQMSGAVQYTAQAAPPPPPPPPPPGGSAQKIMLAAAPSSLSIAQGQSGSTSISVTAQPVPFPSPVSLSCFGLSAGVTCSFAPASVVPGSGAVASLLTVSIPVTRVGKSQDRSRGQLLYAIGFLGLGFPAVVILGQNRRKKLVVPVTAIAVTIGLLLLSSCAGGGQRVTQTAVSSTQQPVTYTITVVGNSGAVQGSTSMTITVH